jgi:hypothetical protein
VARWLTRVDNRSVVGSNKRQGQASYIRSCEGKTGHALGVRLGVVVVLAMRQVHTCTRCSRGRGSQRAVVAWLGRSEELLVLAREFWAKRW